MQMEFCRLTKEEYAAFAAPHPYRTFLNLPESLETRSHSGDTVEFFGVRRDGELVCATPLVSQPAMKIYRTYYAQRGFLIDYGDRELLRFFTKELCAYAKANKGLVLTADPYVLYRERDIDGEPVPGGFCRDDVVEALKDAGFTHKGFTRGYTNASQNRWMFSLYLKGRSEDEIYKQFDEQTRWSVNKTIKQGIKVRELPLEEIDIYTKMMDETAERRGFESRSHRFYKDFVETYGDHCKLLLAYLDLNEFRDRLAEEKTALLAEIAEMDERLATMPNNKKAKNKKRVAEEALALNEKKAAEADELEKAHGSVLNMATSCFTVYDNEIVYLFSGTDDTFRKYNAPYAIHWDMIRRAIALGIDRYNFYGISGLFGKDEDGYGVYAFKRGFGGVVEELVGDFYIPLRPMMYKVYARKNHE
ncbi:MAG: aminoacyltransferase [Eubacterium sp.]|nr:aminoacyltransferase [Eubacterium sp.]